MNKFLFCAARLLVLCVLPKLAFADTTDVQPQLKSPGRALAWSLCATILPNIIGISMDAASDKEDVEMAAAVVANTGTVLGPSVGYFYGGVHKRGWTGGAIRGVFTGFFLLAANEAENSRGDGEELVASAIATFIIVHAIVDIAQVDGAVRKRNQEMAQTGWQLAPKYFAKSKTPGLQLQITF
ncbi:MAG TPA: hypothetical protein VNL73_09495 [Verrucomicrobiae bacterium]|nr:hypothetical protein [Verrucomicrobiae bacterium]